MCMIHQLQENDETDVIIGIPNQIVKGMNDSRTDIIVKEKKKNLSKSRGPSTK